MPEIGNTDIETLASVNLNHLIYFWAVARRGSVTAAAADLGVSQPSVSEQVRVLERRLGNTLLRRTGRGVSLTPAGEVAMRFAEEIAGICGELVRRVPLPQISDPGPLVIGIGDAVPKLYARAALKPLLIARPPKPVLVREWRVDQLLSGLSTHRLDAVITDSADIPPSPGTSPAVLPKLKPVWAGSSGILLCGTRSLVRRTRATPKALQSVPFLLPPPGVAIRADIDRWFREHAITPTVVAEAEDRALLHNLAEDGHGLVPVAKANAARLKTRYHLHPLMEMRGVRDDYYLITIERERQHPSLAAFIDGLVKLRGQYSQQAARYRQISQPARPHRPTNRKPR